MDNLNIIITKRTNFMVETGCVCMHDVIFNFLEYFICPFIGLYKYE